MRSTAGSPDLRRTRPLPQAVLTTTVNSAPWHLITSEYPPQAGGVSDYTSMVAAGLAAAGDEVHVWCPALTNGAINETEARSHGVTVHRELGRLTPRDLRHVGKLLDAFGAPRRLLLQWVPHGYGYRSMNLPLCLWLRKRAVRRGDIVEIMVHEPYLAFGEGSWKQNGVAAVHRLMTMVLLNAARKVWTSTPAWEAYWRPYALGRSLKFEWLPTCSNIPVVDDAARVRAIRSGYSPNGKRIVGHFGTYDKHTTEFLMRLVPSLLQGFDECNLLLLGRGGDSARDQLIGKLPELAGHVHATGALGAAELSLHVSACDLMLQPYSDGVSTRRTSVMLGLSHGLPIVTTYGKFTESFWADSDALALVSVDNLDGLVLATRNLLSDDAGRHRLSATGRKLYDERFDVKRTITALREAVA